MKGCGEMLYLRSMVDKRPKGDFEDRAETGCN
jgi:hypothetical protein